MRLIAAFVSVLLALRSSRTCALVENEQLPTIGDELLASYKKDADAAKTDRRFESTAIAKVTPGVCYSPFHNAEYPVTGSGGTAALEAAMRTDFAIIKNYFSVVRTYYSSYYGVSVAKLASEAGVQLFLGVFMTTDTWGPGQYTDAAVAARDYPSSVSAILVGNENIAPVGPYTPADIAMKVSDMRSLVATTTGGRAVPVGTVQRAAEWLDPARRDEMLALAAACDVIGVNIYPFFDSNYDASSPLVLLNVIWDRMVAIFGESKLRLTEVGFPTGGAPASYAPNNIPSQSNAQQFYNAFVNWSPSRGGREAFWFMFFDRKPSDTTFQADLERYFGFYTYDKRAKAPDYPVLLSALTQAGAVKASSMIATPPAPMLVGPVVTTPVTNPPPPPPTTTAPPPVTTRPPPPPVITTPPPPPPPPATTRPPTPTPTTPSLPPLTTSSPPPPTIATTPPPTMTRPAAAVTTTTFPPPAIVWITLPSANLPTNVCRVRKVFY